MDCVGRVVGSRGRETRTSDDEATEGDSSGTGRTVERVREVFSRPSYVCPRIGAQPAERLGVVGMFLLGQGVHVVAQDGRPAVVKGEGEEKLRPVEGKGRVREG